MLPGLEVEGVGDVGVPVSASDAKRLIKQAAQAPYGRGEETIVDTKVRRVWQLEPQQFALRNAEWASCLALIVEDVRREFGIAQKVEAQLYKLLVYEKGSFFAPHRDTEKAERMFATLVVCLPSQHEGGTLMVSHDEQTKRIDFGGEASRFQMQYAAFYADCQHEVTPVTSGYRVCLVYNLAIAKSKTQPSAPVSGGAIESAAALLAKLFAEESRVKIAIPLKHQYTEAGLGPDAESSDDSADDFDDEDDDFDDDFGDASDEAEDSDDEWDDDSDEDDEPASRGRKLSAKGTKLVPEKATGDAVLQQPSSAGEQTALPLKGSDRAWMNVLSHAAEQSGCQAFLALLTHWQSGSVDCNSIDYDYQRERLRRRMPDESSAEFEEVFDESMSLSHWFNAAGQRQPFAELHLAEAEVISDVATKDRPYRQEVHEATGNEGVSMERWYHQAVIVIWPQAQFFGILAGAGPVSAVPALEQLIDERRRAIPMTRVQDRAGHPDREADCHTFAKEIIARWRKQMSAASSPWDTALRLPRRGAGEKSLAARMLSALQAIDDEKLSSSFVSKVLPTDGDGSEGAELATLVQQHGWKNLAEPLRELFAQQQPGTSGRELSIPVTLFEALCCHAAKPSSERVTPERLTVCRSLADELEQVIDRWDGRKWDSWKTESDHRLGIVEPVVRALTAIEATESLERFVARATSDPKHYDLHAVLIPAVTTLLSDRAFNAGVQPSLGRSACEHLHQHCIAELITRTAERPQPPADWSRDTKIDCQCADCRELSEFLNSKTESVHLFRRRKELRQHLHREIDKHQCDVTHVTDRRGSPQTLVCTKTQARYERRLSQSETDQRLLEELEQLSSSCVVPKVVSKPRPKTKNP